MLSSTDIYVLAGAVAEESEGASLRELARDLHVDHTLVYRSLARAEEAGLYSKRSKAVNRANLEELLAHAVRFIAPTELGQLTRGVPAAWAAEPVSRTIRQRRDEPPPVWPDATGHVRGQALKPLHPSAPRAIEHNPELASLLAIIDSLRAGDVRTRKVAAGELVDALRMLPVAHSR